MVTIITPSLFPDFEELQFLPFEKNRKNGGNFTKTRILVWNIVREPRNFVVNMVFLS